MQFINPGFLYALGFLAIPIVIHLFNFRRPKKVLFSDIRFLKQVIQENKKQRNIKHFLILLMRLLALTCLVFAFANPFIPKGNQQNQSNAPVFIYIDNSFSMLAKGKEAELLESAKSKARNIVNAYGDKHSFQLLSNDFQSKHRVNYSKKEILSLIDEIQVSPASKSLAQVFSRQKSQTNQGTIAYWIGDAQATQLKLNEFKIDTGEQIRYVPIPPENINNCWVDTVWMADPVVKKNQACQISALIKNKSTNDIENQTVSLILDGKQKAIQSFNCKAGASEKLDFQINLNDGDWHRASVKITDYPISFDDEYFFSFKVADQVNILQVYEQSFNPAFSQLYELDPTYRLQKSKVQSLKLSDLGNYQLLILDGLKNISSGLWNELQRFISNGGIVVLLPHNEQVGYNEVFANLGLNFGSIKKGKLAINKIETSDPLLKGVFQSITEQTDFPELQQGFYLQTSSQSGFKTIMKTEDGSGFLIRKNIGKGQFYVTASSLGIETGNFTQHAFFVPVFLQMPFQVKSRIPLFYLLGSKMRVPVPMKNGEQLYRLKLAKEEFICETDQRDGNSFAILPNELSQAGFYQLNSGKEQVPIELALNYPRLESDLSYEPLKNLEEKGLRILDEDDRQLGNIIKSEDNGISLWRYFLAATFLFFLFEMFLLKRKTN